jgi:soluble epoxide hydrolase / lipid-phosphate phosphatase
MDFTAPKTAQTNGIEMEYFEQGEGTPVLRLHGFPENPFSWQAPEDAQTYGVKNLVADVSGLLDALGIEQAVWFGHDWGSMPAWFGGVYAPDRVLGVGSLCTPYFTWEAPQDMIEIYDELRRQR